MESRDVGVLRAGPVWTRVDARVDTGAATLPAVKETTAGVRAFLFIDQTDRAYFPARGFGVEASAYGAIDSFGSDRTYQRLDAQVRAPRAGVRTR